MISNLTPEQIAEIVEFGEAEAQLSFGLYAPPEFARPFRLAAKRIGSLRLLMIPELDTPFFNRILGLGIGSPASESMLDEAIGFFQDAGCTNYMAQVSPMAQPAECPQWLIDRGLLPSSNWAKMVRGDDPAPVMPTDLRLESIGKDQADDFASLVLTTFEIPGVLRPLMKCSVGQPGWHSYLAFDGDKPVSVASIFINGEVGWLGNMGTLKQYRRHGAQGALFARCIQDGLALGCKWFITETGEDKPEDPNPSYHNMLRSGFQLTYLRRNYVHRESASPVKLTRRALFVAAYTLKFAWQRLWVR
jgi:hypothetical protein